METVFKVALNKRLGEDDEKPFIPRRVHKKSRGGCILCKRRRIKCDESKPRCSRCIQTDSKCAYSSSSSSSPKTLSTGQRSRSLTGDMYSMSVDLLETDLNHLLTQSASCEPIMTVRILQHFQSVTSLTIGGPKTKTIMHNFVAKKAWQYPYLMHMVLTISSAHLKRLYSDAAQLKFHHQYSITEATNWESGLQLYRELLKDAEPDFDTTLATTFLTICTTFSIDDDIPSNAYYGDDESFRRAVNPLAATGGFRALQDIFGDFMDRSMWREVLISSDDDQGTFSNGELKGTDGLPAAFVDLCDLDTQSTNTNNEYHHIIRLLTPLLRLELGDPDRFTKLIAFCGRTWPFFRPLLLRKDPRGLLLIAYWFALLPSVDQWWLNRRARTQCTAIVTYLSELQDHKISALLLLFPASFGQADLSYIWESQDDNDDSAKVFERYFQKTLDQNRAPASPISPPSTF